MKTAAFTKFLLAAALFAAPVAVFAQGRYDGQTIQHRKADQQSRIQQGDRSGQLTRGENARLEHQERGINREERGMRAQDHGRLSRVDRRVIRHQQNRESRRIYRDKHNGRVR